MEYNHHHFVKLFTREMTIQRLEVIGALATRSQVNHLILIPTGECLLADFWFEKDSWRKYCHSLYPELAKRGWLKSFIKKYRDGKKIFLSSSGAIFDKSDKLSIKDLHPYYQQYMGTLKSPWGEIMWQPWALDDEFVPKIKELLLKEVGDEKFHEYWDIINLPTDYIAVQRAKLKVYESFLKGGLDKEMDSIVKEFAWLSVYNYRDPPAKKGYFFDFVKNLTKEQAKEKRGQILGYVGNNKHKVEKLLKQIKSKELRGLLEIINFYVVFRTWRVEILKESFYQMSKYFSKLLEDVKKNKKGDWQFDDVTNFTYKEICAYFEEGVPLPELEQIRDRRNLNYIHYYIGGEFNLIKNKEDIDYIKKQMRLDSDIREFKGSIASRGKAIGRCKLVFSADQLGKVQEGDILVAPMTFPDYVPALGRAAAFVTNEGGITSHAAIISREMGKPCIVGTEIATVVLHDGDLIEVDAVQGVVKILKRAGDV